MAYRHLDYNTIKATNLRKSFHRADLYLRDVYGMFRGLPPAGGDGGGGNFAMALVLLCVIDGLARIAWPNDEQEKRFKALITRRLHWGAPGRKSRWFNRANGAKQLYLEFRNTLVHELAQDKPAKSRPSGFTEPVIARWGEIPETMRDIALLDALPTWNDAWPILYHGSNDEDGKPRLKLVTAALYWAVKNVAEQLVAEHRSST